ncbi:heme biosynthesis HemY N-terminal domain-containing protein [Rhodospirillaceae bacterium SYSU D60014]|uniref:heme biosynthesis protein HemY n=1 Tax=Virgifigura deserti TaxID=2268457 RepID=UPI000E674DAA
MTVRRALLYFIKLAILVAAAVWLAERPGTVSLDWLGYRIETSVGLLLVAILLLAVLAAFLFELWRLLWRAPRWFGRARAERRRHKGYRALTQGMVAVAAGDADEAKRQARRAHQYLQEPPLTLLLAAQAAQLNGDETAAQRYFTAMLDRPGTRFLGLRGLLTQALRKGDEDEARRLAEQAQDERPGTGWALTTLLDLQRRAGDWAAAEETLRAATKHKAIEPAAGRRMRAVVLTERARGALAQGPASGPAQASDQESVTADKPQPVAPDEAIALARQAVDLAPDLVPARALLAMLLSKVGKRRRAAKVVEQGWARTPHPNLAAAYAAVEPTESPVARVRRFEALAALNPGHRESHLALAEAALAAQLWGQARSHLEKAMELDSGVAPSARVCRLMARLEEGEHGEAAARRWLVAAAEAESDPAWTCQTCGTPTAEWRALCPQCGAFDSLQWRAAPRPATLVLEATGEGTGESTGRALVPTETAAAANGNGYGRSAPPTGTARTILSGAPVDAARLVN